MGNIVRRLPPNLSNQNTAHTGGHWTKQCLSLHNRKWHRFNTWAILWGDNSSYTIYLIVYRDLHTECHKRDNSIVSDCLKESTYIWNATTVISLLPKWFHMWTLLWKWQLQLYLCARKSPQVLHLISQKFPQCCFWNSSGICLIDNDPLLSFQGRLSSSSDWQQPSLVLSRKIV